MAQYIESREQEDGSWKTYLTWDGNEKSEEEIIITENNDKIVFKYSPVLFGCMVAKNKEVKLHNVIDKKSKNRYIKAEHYKECPSYKDLK